MKHLILLFLLTSSLFATPTRHEFASEDCDHVYYVDFPERGDEHPFIIAIEGSYVAEVGPESVLRLHSRLADPILDLEVGIITMERRGVDGDQIDAEMYHRFNTPSQRLQDHLQLIQHLQDHPPQNWNGELILLGGSEGGPIAVKLAYAITPSACIALVGCGDQSFREYIWNVLQAIKASNISMEEYLPSDRSEYDDWCETMKANPDPSRWWFGQTFLYWADALDQTEYQEFLGLKCPALVIAGSEDIECASTDRLIARATQNNQEITYIRVEGMAHDALDPRWSVMDIVRSFLTSKRLCKEK